MNKFVDISLNVLKSKCFITYFIVFIVLTAEIWMFESQIGFWGFWPFNASQAVGDALILTALLMFLPRKYRWLSVCFTWFWAILLYANVVYNRFSGDVLSLQLIFHKGSYSPVVWKTVPSLIAWKDLFWLLPPAISGLTLLYRKPYENIALRVKVSACVVALGYFTLSYAAIAHYRAGWLKVIGQTDVTTESIIRQNLGLNYNHRIRLTNNGTVIYTLFEISNLFDNKKITLSQNEKASVEAYINKSLTDISGSMHENKDKNLIFILVESLNASIIGKEIDGRQVTPVLDSLCAMEGTISALKVKCQTALGESSDGQLIYNTGLLPLPDELTIIKHVNNRFLSLASILNRKLSAYFNASEEYVWNHAENSKAFGYNIFSDSKLISNTDKEISDTELFDYSYKQIKQIKTPYFLFAATETSHFPYSHIDSGNEWIKGSSIDARYARAINYVDREIGRFLNRLEADSLLENTIIVIASDHNAPLGINDRNHDECIPFIALNTGNTIKINHPVNQSDIFPTVLDIMGCTDSGWRGVGKSMLSTETAFKTDSAQYISDLIIRSDYFNERE